MRFERGLRSTAMKPYPVGYVALPTDDFNRDSPPCRFGGLKDPGVWLKEEDLPVVIEISVRMTPLWVENETAFATLDKSEGCFIYPPMRVFQRSSLRRQGMVIFKKPLARRKFLFSGIAS